MRDGSRSVGKLEVQGSKRGVAYVEILRAKNALRMTRVLSNEVSSRTREFRRRNSSGNEMAAQAEAAFGSAAGPDGAQRNAHGRKNWDMQRGGDVI